MRIKAFGSTDIGISFLIDIDNIRIFHAGDLNNWHWEEESTPEEIAGTEKNCFGNWKHYHVKRPISTWPCPVDPR
ncbi:MAG: hypothetical protein V8S95_06185 [Odoribacter sp.]